MFGLTKLEKEKNSKQKEQLEEKIKKYKEMRDKYFSLVGCEVNVGLGISGIIDEVIGDNLYYEDTNEHKYYFKIRILSIAKTQISNNIAISSGFFNESGVNDDDFVKNTVFEYIKINCQVILKLNGDK